ncbi:Peptidase C50 separase [Penicillium chermesinum]|nr:Peptidase C50 separase [Penicillium chermesinum]
MAVTVLPADSLTESVKQAVRSATTCSDSTVLSLQSLLRGSSQATDKLGKKPPKSTKDSSRPTSRSRTIRAKPTTANDSFQSIVDQDGLALSPQEKLVLATEIFNTTLKTLTDATKVQPTKPAPKRQTATSDKLSARKTFDKGIAATAECARLALSVLRALKTDQSDGFPNMQLEQGLCILAGKLISLGLYDAAAKELKSLKRRIQQYLDQSKTGKKSTEIKDTPEDEVSKDRLSDLIAFSNLNNAQAVHGLLVSFQANAMRLIAADRKVSTIQRVYQLLQLSNPSSPAQIITSALESGNLAKDKAAVQLQLLSNAVLSMVASDAKDSVKPCNILNLQLLSLEIRCLGWKISGHQCDESKELIDPLLRYLAGFSHRSKAIEKSEFAMIYTTITRIQASSNDIPKKPQGPKDKNSAAKLMTMVGQIGLDAGCLDESLKLFSQSIAPLSSSQSLSLATIRCKIAAVHFQSLKGSRKPSQKVLESLSAATDSLGLQLRGSTHDLDELLVEAARLKKVALAWFGDAITKAIESETEKNEAASQIREYLQAFLRFLRRYVGRAPEDSDQKETELFQARLSLSKNIIFAAVDSAVAVGKLSVTSERPLWNDMLSILADCHRLLISIDDGEIEPDISSTSNGLVKLSNLYWSRYIKEKEAGHGYRELIPLLKQSTQVLSGCSPSHRVTAFAALKFERMAHLYMDGNLQNESEKAFRQSVKEYVDSGVLDQMLEDGAGYHFRSSNQDPQSPGFMLGRVLSTFLKAKLRRKRPESHTVYDDIELDTELRGFILEWQLNLLADMNSFSSNEGNFQSMLIATISSLLEIYSLTSYPIRRGRAIITALRFLLEHPISTDSAFSRKLLDEGKVCLGTENCGNDTDLAPFSTHIKNSLRIILGFHEGQIDPGVLDDTLASWSSMIRRCSDYESLALCVHDPDYLILQLKALVDYTEIHGLWKPQLSALELILKVSELQQTGDLSDAITILSRLVLQHCRIGHCQKAGELLSRGEQYASQYRLSSLASISYKLAQVEFFLETDEVEKATSALSAAKKLYEKAQQSDELANVSVLLKISWERLIADAAFVQSRLAAAQGTMSHALYFAKLSVKLNCRIWAKVEKLAERKSLAAAGPSDIDTVADGVAKLDSSQDSSSPVAPASYIQGAPFWPHLGSYHSCLLNLANLSAHHGLFQDAIYYGEQALKIDKTLDANVRLVAAQTQLGVYWILGGASAESSKQLQTSIEAVSLQMAIASLHQAQGQFDKALSLLKEADKSITTVASTDASDASDLPSIAALDTQMSNLGVRNSRRPPSSTTVRTTRHTRTASATPSLGNKAPYQKPAVPEVQSKSLLQLKGDLLRQQADCLREMRDFEQSAYTLKQARLFATARESKVSLEIGESEYLLAEAIRHFASHAVYCVLPESTISLPSLKTPSKAGEEASVQLTKAPAKRGRAQSKGARVKAQKASEAFSIMLAKANDCLTSVFTDATVLGSTLQSHAASRLMSRISMLSHATNPGDPATWAQSPANMNEIGRVGAFARERMAIDFDRYIAEFSGPLLWPAALEATELDEDLCTRFAENYVDILPENWNVLSLSLSADGTEFVVSRLQKNRSPFLLRLPLRRGNTDDDDEEQFTFEEGKEEMQELIKLANQSAHAAKAQTDAQSKKEWWKTRETLDRRMESLLHNVENIWFGGFHSTALGRFSSAFQGILDKHLPSRQKGGKASSPRLTLHQNVLELFIGLRDLEEQEEPEDTLMDLLYFVVDILQFQGERNAYDEIDFDMMVVDTLDALRGYHDSAREELASRPPSHTVLVLDKALHLFPWESLPCLQGFPVCRVPSLQCLRERVLQFREARSGALIDITSGTFILNPTGDLRTTQATFEAALSRLESWTGIVKREPSEEEFRQALESKDLFLYFGHGSGAQYIRGRTIKRLSKCGVAFLMGCSSGALTEAGEYEPYGTPMNYLHAGSPALVATLWDVTDKDIDRFTTSTLNSWGLLGNNGKSQSTPGDTSLDAAVAGSRRSCVLKYLNGAAPVVYGVPVFLD